MKKMLTIGWIVMVAIGLIVVITSLVMVSLPSEVPTEEDTRYLTPNEIRVRERFSDLDGLDSHGFWGALGIAGGIVTVIGAIPLTATIVKNRQQKAKTKKK